MAKKKLTNVDRRTFLRIAGTTGLASIACYFGGGCAPGKRGSARGKANGRKVVVIGIDGFDPVLAERLMDEGRLPNMMRMRGNGGYSRLGTTTPPQSPVAWASFITGADAGVHGIFDFVHRDPSKQCEPYYSAAQTMEATDGWEVGEHKIPLDFWPFNHGTTETLLRREGTPFWEHLDKAGIPSCFYDIPSNYPPSPSTDGNHCCLSGMGTPDLMGGYGTYQLFSSRLRKDKQKSGGIHKPIKFKSDAAKVALTGPTNVLLKNPQETQAEFTVYRDRKAGLARIEFQGRTLILKPGEWTDWQQVDFTLDMPSFLPNEKATGICRFLLQEVSPHFRLYVSPINIDPANPGGQKISEPDSFVTRIADDLGAFPTTGFQEDHKALSNKVFTDEEYRKQADYVLEERIRLLDYARRNYDDGLLFFYFSSTDLQAHMFYWEGDDPHPVRSPEDAKKYMGVLEDLYARMDGVVGDLLDAYGDETTVMILSDHGFCNFSRQFNLNTWLRENGYIGPDNCTSLFETTRGQTVDWSKTRAYGLGLNGLYVNLKGRERDGIVDPSEKDALIEELREKLLAVRDPKTGEKAISAVYRSDEIYHGEQAANAPDLIVGYRRGWRCSWSTSLGTITRNVFSDNTSAWSADHCMASEELPGVLFCNRPIRHESPSLVDLAPTILEEFGLKVPAAMTGRNVFTAT
jgi:predicted AlkP superfamily phosphohydrolase/phosphomutase